MGPRCIQEIRNPIDVLAEESMQEYGVYFDHAPPFMCNYSQLSLLNMCSSMSNKVSIQFESPGGIVSENHTTDKAFTHGGNIIPCFLYFACYQHA